MCIMLACAFLREREISYLLYAPHLGTKPTTLARNLTENQTCNLFGVWDIAEPPGQGLDHVF